MYSNSDPFMTKAYVKTDCSTGKSEVAERVRVKPQGFIGWSYANSKGEEPKWTLEHTSAGPGLVYISDRSTLPYMQIDSLFVLDDHASEVLKRHRSATLHLDGFRTRRGCAYSGRDILDLHTTGQDRTGQDRMTAMAKLTLMVSLLLCGPDDVSAFQVVDLTHDLSDTTIYWPGNPQYNFTELARGQVGGFWYESNFIAQAEHGGTHVDAPAHFYNGAWRTHQIPMGRLTGPAVIIDVKEKARNNPDYRVHLNDITGWESVNGRIPDNAAVIMNSGWEYKYPNKTAVFGTDTPAVPSTFHFPAWHQDTVTWLINYRHVYMIGVDTPSTDFGQSTDFPTHVLMAKNSVVGLENVANLDKLPTSGSRIFAAVIKIKNGSGGPARIFATISTADEECITSRSSPLPHSISVLGLLSVCIASILLLYRNLW